MEKRNGVLVLMSGGLDSLVTLAVAKKEDGLDPVLLRFSYGQRNDQAEAKAAARIAQHYDLTLYTHDLGRFKHSSSALLHHGAKLKKHATLDSAADSGAEYVPGRNLIFLSVAASYAEAWELPRIYMGFGGLYTPGPGVSPDQREPFVRAAELACMLGTKCGVAGYPIVFHSPLFGMSRKQVIDLGCSLQAPLHKSWSCYAGGDVPCGACAPCHQRIEAGLDKAP